MSSEEETDGEMQQVFGLDAEPVLPKDWMPLEAVAVIKVLTDEGIPTLIIAQTESLTKWEEEGMLLAALDSSRDDMAKSWGSSPDEEEEEPND